MAFDEVASGPIRALFLLGSVSAMGGAERRLSEMLDLLPDHGIAPTIASFSKQLPQPLNGKPRVVTIPGLSIWRLRRLIGRNNFDAVIVYGRRSLYACIAARTLLRGAPSVTVMQTGLDFRRRSLIYSFILRRRWLVRSVICNSTNACELVRTRYKVGADRVSFLPSAIDQRWLTDSPERREPGPVRVAIVGNARAEKNVVGAMRSFRVLANDTRADLTVYASDCSAHRAQADAVNLPNVRFVEGHVLEPSDYDTFDILLHPSVSESLSRAVIEALARGVIVVTGSSSELRRLKPPHQVLDTLELDTLAEALRCAASAVQATEARASAEDFAFNDTPNYVRRLRDLLMVP